jgi:hypothetical protein
MPIMCPSQCVKQHETRDRRYTDEVHGFLATASTVKCMISPRNEHVQVKTIVVTETRELLGDKSAEKHLVNFSNNSEMKQVSACNLQQLET